MTGSWSFTRRLGKSVATSEYPDAGLVSTNLILIDGVAYAQALFDGSVFSSSCWMKIPPTSTDPALLLPSPISAVLGALGFQKLVTRFVDQLGRKRVDVRLQVAGNQLTGWAVANSSMVAALSNAGISASGEDDPLSFFEVLDDVVWGVEFSHVGEPVTIEAPPSDSLIDPDQERCRN